MESIILISINWVSPNLETIYYLFSPFGLETPSENHLRMTSKSSASALKVYSFPESLSSLIDWKVFPFPIHLSFPNHDDPVQEQIS